MYEVRFGPETYRKLWKFWKEDFDEESYDFPFIEMWARYRLDGEFKNLGSSYAILFLDAQAAVEFKLRWL